MNRRSKLNLSPEEGLDKQQPAGFGNSHKQRFNPSEGISLPDTETYTETTSETISQIEDAGISNWLNAKQLLKVTLVVAASGLALYFLKRRLF